MSVLSAVSRFAASFAVLSIAVSLLIGCNETTVSNAILPASEKYRLTDEFITEAVEDFNQGRQRDGDAALGRAVVLMTPVPSEEYNDIGFIEVAKRVASRGRPQDAVRLLEPLTKDRQDPLLWATLADVAKQSGNTPRSASAVSTASEKADAIMKTVGTPEPKQSEAIVKAQDFLRAGEYFSDYAKDTARAIQAYREAYRLVPSDPLMSKELGYILANLGGTQADFNEAVEHTRFAVETVPDQPEYLDAFGWALFKRNDAKQKDLDGAQRRIREAADLAPSLANIHYHLAVVYEAHRLLPDALLEAERACILDTNLKEAVVLRDRLKPIVAALPSPSPSPANMVGASPSPTPTASASPTQK